MGWGRSLPSSFLKYAAAVLLGVVVSAAYAEGDPPGRVARLNYSEGTVAHAPEGEVEWTDADANRPLVRGDKLWTDKGVRAEIQVGSASVRMDGRTQLEVLALDDQTAQLSVTQGTVHVRVRTLPEGENFEIDTPHLAYRAAYPGDYRIDVDLQRGVTRVTILSGTGAVYGDKGQALTMGGGQQITFKGRALAQANMQEQPPQDNFDRWAAERNRREEQSVAARYVPREVVGYQLLDSTGEWRQEAGYGAVWYPQGVAKDWAPYRSGRWESIAPWGWTWVDEAPWAFVTSHYGRWAMVGSRWAWVPGRMGVRPIYAPALVAFVGNGNAPLAVGGKQAVAWFPLAPGEAWQPPYRATPLYISSVNANMPPLKEGGYAYQRNPEALTAISTDDFNRGKPAKSSWVRVAANALTNAQVIAPPPMPAHARTMVARAPSPAPAPAPAPDIQKVTTAGPTVREQAEAQRELAAKAERAKLAEQQRIAEQQRVAQQQRAAEQQRVAEHHRAAEQERVAGQQRLAEQQRVAQQKAQQRVAQERIAAQQQRRAEQQRAEQRAEQQKLAEQQRAAKQRAEQQAKAEQARAAAEAKRADQARRESVARREQARREQVAAARRAELQARREQSKRDEDARRAAHTKQVEQARRAAERDAQVLAAQRSEREAAARRVAEDRERAQRDAWQKQQQALAEQFRREQQLYEEQQQKKQQRARPDLRRSQSSEPEVWQRGVPVLAPGRTS